MTEKTYHSDNPLSSVLIDEEAERDLLGCMILAPDNPALAECGPELFGTQTHRDIAAAILHLVEHRIPLDYLEVIQELRRRSKNPSPAYISDLCQGVVITRPLSRRIEYLRELSNRRQLAVLAEQLAARAPDLADPLHVIVADLLGAVPSV